MLNDDLLGELDFKLLHYGTIITDEDYQRAIAFNEVMLDNVRTRIIKYCDRIYYHKMVNGKLTLLFELK